MELIRAIDEVWSHNRLVVTHRDSETTHVFDISEDDIQKFIASCKDSDLAEAVEGRAWDYGSPIEGLNLEDEARDYVEKNNWLADKDDYPASPATHSVDYPLLGEFLEQHYSLLEEFMRTRCKPFAAREIVLALLD